MRISVSNVHISFLHVIFVDQITSVCLSYVTVILNISVSLYSLANKCESISYVYAHFSITIFSFVDITDLRGYVSGRKIVMPSVS